MTVPTTPKMAKTPEPAAMPHEREAASLRDARTHMYQKETRMNRYEALKLKRCAKRGRILGRQHQSAP